MGLQLHPWQSHCWIPWLLLLKDHPQIQVQVVQVQVEQQQHLAPVPPPLLHLLLPPSVRPPRHA